MCLHKVGCLTTTWPARGLPFDPSLSRTGTGRFMEFQGMEATQVVTQDVVNRFGSTVNSFTKAEGRNIFAKRMGV